MSCEKFISGDCPGQEPGQQKLETSPPTGGDMLKSVYDTDNDGRVDSADAADFAGHATTAGEATAVTGVDVAGNWHYYGTDVLGAAGFHSIPVQGGYTQLYTLWLAQGFSGTATDFLLWLGLEVEYSADGVSGWSTNPAGSYYIRFKDRATDTWSAAVLYVAPEKVIEYSLDGNAPWVTMWSVGYNYIRLSTDGGMTFTAAIKFVGGEGPAGADGAAAPEVQIEYSVDGVTSWHSTFTPGDLYIRFSTDGGMTWSTPALFVDNGAGEQNTVSNQGAGVGMFIQKTGADLEFKSLVAGTNITLTPSADTITIASTGGGGGTDTDSQLLIWQGI